MTWLMCAAVFLVSCGISCQVSAATLASSSSQGFLTFSYGQGGDSLSASTGGQNYSTQAGSGLHFVGGWLFPVSATVPHRFEAQIGAGYVFQNDERSRGDSVSWSRVPIEGLYYYHNTVQKFRLGWGAAYHVAGSLSGKGENSSVDSRAENSWGRLVSIEKLWRAETGEILSVGIRHTWIRYRLTAFDKVVSGDAFSVTFTGFLF